MFIFLLYYNIEEISDFLQMLRIQTSPYLATDYLYGLNVIFQSSDMTMYILFRK